MRTAAGAQAVGHIAVGGHIAVAVGHIAVGLAGIGLEAVGSSQEVAGRPLLDLKHQKV